jgi:superfamily II DNA or RNA helicase
MDQLIIVITQKKNLGYVMIPYVASRNEKALIELHEQVTDEHLKQKLSGISESDKELLRTLFKINEQTLYKLFSRDNTLKQFYSTLKDDYVQTHMRPYIEKYLTKAIVGIAQCSIPVYYKDTNYSNLYETDRIHVARQPASASFHFNLESDQLTYNLKIVSEKKEINLLNREVKEIATEPALLLLNQHLYWFDNIDSKKFRPFISKTHISIPERSIDNYMSAFVEKCIRDHQVQASGFQIIDRKVTSKAKLVLEHNLSRVPVLTLKFQYDQRTYLAGTKSKVFVNLQKHEGHYIFERLQRDNEWEIEQVDFLVKGGLSNSGDAQFAIPGVEEPQTALYNLICWLNQHTKALKKQHIEFDQSRFEDTYFSGSVNLQFKCTEKEDWFDIQAHVQVGEFSIPFYQFRKHIIRQKREYVLPNGEIFILPEEWFSRYGDLMQFSVAKGDAIQLDKMYFQFLEAAQHEKGKKKLSEKMLSLQKNGKTQQLSVPESIQATLRPYQVEGYSWMHALLENQFGGILADDMGLGKTLQTLALLTRIYDQPQEVDANSEPSAQVQLSLFEDSPIRGFNHSQQSASLIVMPTSLVHNWHHEIQKFAPHLKTYIYTGNKRLKTKDIGKIFRHYHIVLSTYGIVRNDVEYLQNYPFQYLILDESQNIKNPSSKVYQAVTELKAMNFLVLTGTPIENSLMDLWAQLNFVNRGFLGSLNYFKNHYITPITKQKNVEQEKKLQVLIDPFVLRRTKEMVAKDLPPLSEQVVYCDMSPEQKKFYEREKSGVRNELLNTFLPGDKVAFMALQALTKLRQLANHPRMIDESYEGSSGKFDQVISSLEDIVSEKHKVLVFSSFVKDLELIEAELKAKKLAYSKLTGSTGDRESVIKRFTREADCRIFLISLKAGGVGLNLVEADYVFVLNPWWNPAAEAQAINRAHRIGQTKNVFVYRFISSETIEEKIVKLQERKRELAGTFINTDNPLKNLTKEEIEELFA